MIDPSAFASTATIWRRVLAAPARFACSLPNSGDWIAEPRRSRGVPFAVPDRLSAAWRRRVQCAVRPAASLAQQDVALARTTLHRPGTGRRIVP